jgi:hypothetical protein
MSYHLSALKVNNSIRIIGTTNSDSVTTGSLLIDGGMGVSKSTRSNGNISTNGNISARVSSTSTSDSIDNEFELIVTGTATISLPNTVSFPEEYKGVVYFVTKQEESGPSFTVTIETPNVNTISHAGLVTSSFTMEGPYLSTTKITNIENVWHVTVQSIEQKELQSPTGVTASSIPGVPGGASISYTTPVTTSQSKILWYRVTSTPGTITSIGYKSPVIMTGLTSGVAYTFQVQGVLQLGVGNISGNSNSITPV